MNMTDLRDLAVYGGCYDDIQGYRRVQGILLLKAYIYIRPVLVTDNQTQTSLGSHVISDYQTE